MRNYLPCFFCYHGNFYQMFLSHTFKISKVIGDKALSIDLSLLLFKFKGRQFQREATLSFCQLVTGRKRPNFLLSILLKLCLQILSLLQNL